MKKIKTAKSIAQAIQRICELVENIEAPKDLAQKLARIPSLSGKANKLEEFITGLHSVEERIFELKEAATKRHRTKVKQLTEKELIEILPAKEALRNLEVLLQSEDFGVQCDSQVIAAEEAFLIERRKFRNAALIKEIYKDSLFFKEV